MVEEIIQELDTVLPKHFYRKTVEHAMKATMGGLLKARTLANMDCRGEGPGGTMVNGKRMYEKQTFLAWLRAYLEKSSNDFTSHKGKEI